MSVVSATSGTCLTDSSTCAASRRKREMIVAGAVEGQAEDRHVIDAFGFDQRPADAGRDAVEVRAQFFGEFDQAALRVLADLEAHDDQALAVAGGGIDIFHAGDFPQQFFHRAGGAFLDFLGAGARHGDHHIDHRHLDLRFLLARQQHDGRRA